MTDGWNTFALLTPPCDPAGLRQLWRKEWIQHCAGVQLAAASNFFNLALSAS